MVTRREIEAAVKAVHELLAQYKLENPLPPDYAWCYPQGKVMIADHTNEDWDTGTPDYLEPPPEGEPFIPPTKTYDPPSPGSLVDLILKYHAHNIDILARKFVFKNLSKVD